MKFVLRIQRRPLLTCATLKLTIVTLMPIVLMLLQVSHAPATLASVGTALRVQILKSAQPTPIIAVSNQLVLTPPVASLVNNNVLQAGATGLLETRATATSQLVNILTPTRHKHV